MSISTVLMKALAGPLAKLLLKRYLSDLAEAVGERLLDVVQRRIEDYSEQREAQRLFERLGERIVTRLVPLFEHESRNADINIPAVAAELAETLGGRISAESFLTRDLDPARLTTELRSTRPVHKGPFSAAEIALYDRALEEAVRYVVQIASHVPKFEEAYASVSLQRLDRMSEDLEEVLDTTRRIEQTVAQLAAHRTDADEHFARYEADYRQAVMRNLDYLELFGADISPESRRHALSVGYVSLNLKESAGNRDQSESLPVETVLDNLNPEQGRLLIRGEAGSGKSTLSRWTAMQAASFGLFTPSSLLLGDSASSPLFPVSQRREGLEMPVAGNLHSLPRLGELASIHRQRSMGLQRYLTSKSSASHWRMRIPFLVRLRDCRDGQLPGPDDFPRYVAREIGNPPPNWVASILRQGDALILLDGIDEVPNVHRDRLRRAIENIVDAYPNNYFITTTRPAAVDDGWLASAGFREAVIDPMSDVDRIHFIERWHVAVGRELARLGRPDPTLPYLASELIDQLPDHPPVARLAINPLLCAMICALHRERSQELPESQAELCEAICHMLLHRRERESGLAMDAYPEAYRALTYPEKRAIVQGIAHYMVRNGESTMSWEQAGYSTQDSLRQYPDRKNIDPDDLLKMLIEHSGVLRETRPGEIDFIHNTLKEYLAAERFADADDAGQLADRYDDPSWQHVILFSVATNRRGFATRIIQRILEARGRGKRLGDEEMRARHLFALRCRAAALHLSPALITELDSLGHGLFPPRSMADADALASGGDAAVDYLQSHDGLTDYEAAACVRTLRLIGTRKAKRALRSYLEDDRTTVAFELAQALNPLEVSLVRTMVQQGSPVPKVIRDQITDLSPLGSLDLASLKLANTRVAHLAPLARLTRLQALNIMGTPVNDLAPLAGLTRLQILTLMNTRVSDLAPLAELTELQTLDLKNTWVSDLTPLSRLSSLHSLDLSETWVSDLAPLTGLTSLQMLDLVSTRVSEIASLTGLTNLELLKLTGTHVSDLSPLAALIRLQWLDLSLTPVSDLSHLARLKDMQTLVLKGTEVIDLAPLARLARLQSLDLAGTPVGNLAPLTGLMSLQSLNIVETQVTDLTPLAELTSLRMLDLRETNVRDLAPLAHLDLDYLTVSPDVDTSMLEGKPDLTIFRF